jgi:sodium/bile acid cotransporter 7
MRRLDPFLLVLLAAVGIATVAPVRGGGAVLLDRAVTVVIALLFFLYGARLSLRAAVDGLRNWRLHTLALAATFVVFPLLALAGRPLLAPVLGETLYLGLVFLAAAPSTVQSSIAFTSIAGGNVAGALCNASLSNIAGVVLTPLLVGLFVTSEAGGLSLHSMRAIALQLLVPFVVGQLARRWIGDAVIRHSRALGYLERGSIVLVVYAAFSAGMVAGVWRLTEVSSVLVVFALTTALLVVILAFTLLAGRWWRLPEEDRIAVVFCGSTKSLASGVPMAGVLFGGQVVALVLLPLMLFHQLQLMVCAVMARRWGAASR